MHVKPPWLLGREPEWAALTSFVERRQRLALVYGPRRVGKSFLLDALVEATGGRRYQALAGVEHAQRDDLARTLGAWFGVGPLRIDSWAEAFERIERLDTPVVVIDELPYLSETSPELLSVIQRYVDNNAGPPLIVAGSSRATMTELLAARAPLHGRAAAVVVPTAFSGSSLAELWGVDERAALWIDAAVGGLPGYRPLLESPGGSLDEWMVEFVLAASSPLLDAAEAALAEATPRTGSRQLFQTILSAIARGEHTFGGIARVVGGASTALTRPLAALERSGLVARVPDPLRSRRDRYDVADPHLRFWLAVIAPHRVALLAGRAPSVWSSIGSGTWPSQVLGPRWENVARDHLGRAEPFGAGLTVGATVASDRAARVSHEADLVIADGNRVVAVGEAKLRELGPGDVARLDRVRAILDADDATLVLASADRVDAEMAARPDVMTITPTDVYGNGVSREN